MNDRYKKYFDNISPEKKLTEEQLVTLINSNLEPVRMKEVIEIAVMENEWE